MKGDIVMTKEKLDELIAATKLGELISKKEDEDKKCCKKCSTIIIAVLAIVGAVAAVAGNGNKHLGLSTLLLCNFSLYVYRISRKIPANCQDEAW